MSYERCAAVVTLAAILIATDSTQTVAQSDKSLGWSFEGEVSGVWVSGNSTSRTIGASSAIAYKWDSSELRFSAGGLRTQSTLVSRTAVGSPTDFTIKETRNSATTAEAYNATSAYEYEFSSRSFAIGGIDWRRNTFSGIDSRFLIGAGAGNTWVEGENTIFKTSYGFTYTFQSEVVQNPFNATKFPGLRVSYLFKAEPTATTGLESSLAADWNLENTKDVRTEWSNSVSVSISSILALKPSLKLLWRNDPALKEVPLQDESGEPTGDKVVVPLKHLDSFFTIALVLTL